MDDSNEIYIVLLHLTRPMQKSLLGELNQEKNTYEVKIKKEHAASMNEEDKTNLEPITAETANNTSKNPNVVVEKSGGSK